MSAAWLEGSPIDRAAQPGIHLANELRRQSNARRSVSTGRNEPCPCGSGRKYKNCCLGRAVGSGHAASPPAAADPGRLLAMYRGGRFAELAALLQHLLRTSSQSGFLWGLLGASLEAQGQDGLAAWQRAADLSPQDFEALSGLGRAFVAHSRLADAVASFRRALAVQPANPLALFHLGDALRMLGHFAEAAQHLGQLPARAPDFVDGLVALALTLGELGRLAEAERHCRRALQIAPATPVAHFCLGNVLLRSARLDEARQCFIAALQSDPNWLPALEGLGNVLQELGQTAQASECYRRCLELDPLLPSVHANLGRLFVEQNRFAEAEQSYRQAVQADPQDPALLEKLASVLQELGRAAEARNCYLQAIALQPERASARLALATAALPVLVQSRDEAAGIAAAFAASLDELADWLHASKRPPLSAADLASTQQAFFLAYRTGNHVGLLSRYADLVGEFLGPQRRPQPPPRPRVRLLIVSHHLRWHSVWNIVLRGLLQHIDRQRFELIAYHLGNVEDEETALARRMVDGWRDRQTVIDAAGWLAAAAEDAPDVVFYPEIGMSSLCYFLAAHRLAPLQVAGWGHPITTGLESIDLFLSGELLESPQADAHYREQLIRLPGTGCCTTSLPLAAEELPDDLETRLRATQGPRFVIAQRAIKFDPAYDDHYARIAAASGACVFIILRDPVCPWATDLIVARLESTFHAHGLDPARHLLCIRWLSPARFLTLLDRCDVYLDCPAFSGYTTAWMALHRGLPIVTLEGPALRQRLAAGLLRRAGLPAGIAASADEYVAIAAELAASCRDELRRGELRATIRAAAPAVDDDLRVVRAFEECLLSALAARVAGVRRAPDEA
ncbi:tetratricopeptide repeat protein [Accumulibacter sp.]|uniref:tetratricopeptide repeat protein n=1 Tax=Accumulibacter sp. TaxID=2053492 RepID=UPI0025FC7DC6|nr:tetratricopeptide repeat protein [Accumulibacter sp.]MCM8614070.1 tetratricopeptide repeat protein [Accumulibacter sp.]MCM8634461.1 tetratricopeptide repeat protein [Accumulibacter sp.]MCM8641557.1 tetratricopeptide repeat protein [Accumulibacter sp.]